ncbi:MAG: DUF4367 domain-containing protein, partial [Ruminococcaceae bacterium]|nr:DUF4367 domain-containing protein [Oscillospiraceae bacterium]
AELEKQGLEDVNLLPIFYGKNCKLELLEQCNNEHYNLNFSFTDFEVSGYISIRKYASYENSLDSINLYSDVEQIKQININGTDVIIASSTDSKTVAYYNKGNSTYRVMFKNLSFDEVINILQNS